MNAKERVETAVRNILSGNNGCGTLAKAAAEADATYFERAIMPVVEAYEEELKAEKIQRARLLKEIEQKRFALEMVISNLGQHINGEIRKAVEIGLPGRQF